MHANASLFKAPEIKRAVQSGQAQIGEILLANFANENPMYALDGMPFLATQLRRIDEALRRLEAGAGQAARRAGHQAAVHGAVGAAGHLLEKGIASAADMKGIKWRAYSPATAKIAELVGAQPVTVQQAELSAGHCHRRGRLATCLGLHRLRHQDLRDIKNFYDTQAWLPKNAVLVNAKAFDALDKADAGRLLKAAADAETRGWKVAEEKNG